MYEKEWKFFSAHSFGKVPAILILVKDNRMHRITDPKKNKIPPIPIDLKSSPKEGNFSYSE